VKFGWRWPMNPGTSPAVAEPDEQEEQGQDVVRGDPAALEAAGGEDAERDGRVQIPGWAISDQSPRSGFRHSSGPQRRKLGTGRVGWLAWVLWSGMYGR